MAQKVLVVAPKTDLLLVEAEVTAVVNHLRGYILNDVVTANFLLDKLAEQWDIVWFATHGDEQGIYLSDGPIAANLLTSFIRTAGATLVIFNTCSSYNVAREIYNELLIDLVCTIRPVPDRDAFFTGKSFAIQLGRGKSPHEAYLLAKLGGDKDYIFMNRQESSRNAPGGVPAISPNEVMVLSAEVRRLVEKVDGNERDDEPGLIKTVKNIDRKVTRQEGDISFLRMGIWIIAGSSTMTMIILIGVLLFR